MVAAMLMLPDPRREYEQTFDSMPIARAKGFVLARIGFGPETEFAGVTDQITVDASFCLARKSGRRGVDRRSRTLAPDPDRLRLNRRPPVAVVDLIRAHRDISPR